MNRWIKIERSEFRKGLSVNYQIKVLIVDDSTEMREATCLMLNQFGFADLVEAADGLEAWELLTNPTLNFGLIISDQRMPNCTGIELLKLVRKNQELNKIPFMIVTSDNDALLKEQAKDAGANFLTKKPLNKQEILLQLQLLVPKQVVI